MARRFHDVAASAGMCPDDVLLPQDQRPVMRASVVDFALSYLVPLFTARVATYDDDSPRGWGAFMWVADLCLERHMPGRCDYEEGIPGFSWATNPDGEAYLSAFVKVQANACRRLGVDDLPDMPFQLEREKPELARQMMESRADPPPGTDYDGMHKARAALRVRAEAAALHLIPKLSAEEPTGFDGCLAIGNMSGHDISGHRFADSCYAHKSQPVRYMMNLPLQRPPETAGIYMG